MDKPVAGTGAGLLVEALTLPGLATSPTITTVGKLEDERQFRMVALLRSGPIVVLLDNINKKLNIETFAAMITAPSTYRGGSSDRPTSSSSPFAVRGCYGKQRLGFPTGHTADGASSFELDAGLEHPEEGRVFRHDRLMDWGLGAPRRTGLGRSCPCPVLGCGGDATGVEDEGKDLRIMG